jgi:phosphoglycolate phosphatase-like HAD superfamily hydrolase
MCLSNFENELAVALTSFKQICEKELMQCNLVAGVDEFLASLESSSPKYVVSGGLQDEVIMALKNKNIDKYFNGIYGSPRTKSEIMRTIVDPPQKGIFFGDSQLDFEISSQFNCDFVFIYGHTEFTNYKKFFETKPCPMLENFSNL